MSAAMTDIELIGYCEIHCTTERALFSAEHVNRMIELAGNPPGFKRQNGWVSAHAEMQELCDLARARLAPPTAAIAPPVAAGRVDIQRWYLGAKHSCGDTELIIELDNDGEWVKHADAIAWGAQQREAGYRDGLELASAGLHGAIETAKKAEADSKYWKEKALALGSIVNQQREAWGGDLSKLVIEAQDRAEKAEADLHVALAKGEGWMVGCMKAEARVKELEREKAGSASPFCGGGFQEITSTEELRARAEADRQARSRQAIRRAQEAARVSKSNSADEREVFMPVMMTWGSSVLPASSDSSSSSSKFSGSGGSFDGGGASGDWGGSSSSSSSSSDCSSSSSDSGGGSCGGSSD